MTVPPRLTAQHSVLVVDDDEAVRDVVVDVLGDEGYQVRTAANGLAALGEIEADPPSLVLLDMRMPGLDGWQLARRVGGQGIRVPIIVMTADARAGESARDIRADAYLSKPFDIRTLIDTVERVIGDGRSGTTRATKKGA